jgi:hypothetical protein
MSLHCQNKLTKSRVAWEEIAPSVDIVKVQGESMSGTKGHKLHVLLHRASKFRIVKNAAVTPGNIGNKFHGNV